MPETDKTHRVRLAALDTPAAGKHTTAETVPMSKADADQLAADAARHGVLAVVRPA